MCAYCPLFQLWRLFTNFLFFGTIGFNFLFNMIFTYPFFCTSPFNLISIETEYYVIWNQLFKSLTPWRYRYCRMLEEGSFRGRTADFVFMFLFGAFIMTVSFMLDNYSCSLLRSNSNYIIWHHFPSQFSVNFTGYKHSISRPGIHYNVGLCLEPTESLYKNELLWFVKLSSPIFTMGFAWLFSHAWKCCCGGFDG